LKLAPTATLAYYTANFDYSKISNYFNFNVGASAGFIGTQYIYVTEKSGSSIVSQKSLGNLIWTLSNSANSGALHYVTFKGSDPNPFSSFQVLITFISSDNVGFVNYSYASALVTPKTLESIIEINNYPYQSQSNYLSLTMGVVTGNFQVSGSVSTNNVISGTGDDQVYFSLSNEATINGNSVSVTVSSFTQGSDTISGSNSYIQAQAQGKYGGSINSLIVSVDFPAGSANIVYDPTIGQGTPPLTDNSLSVVAIVFIVFGCIAFVVLIVVAGYFIYRHVQLKKHNRPYVSYK